MLRSWFNSFCGPHGWLAKRWLAGLLLLVGLLFAPVVHAAGLLIADGGFGGVLEVKEHDVRVQINNGVAVTHVTQVFHNTENRQVEALYAFPVPKGASVSNFSMWIDGKEMVGEVLEKKRAREIYNSYKQRRRDPGLLEQNDYKTFEMRIFPIGARADQKVEITYYQELDLDHDQATYVYPLATASKPKMDQRVRGRFAFQLEVKAPMPIGQLSSPSHGDEFVVAAHSDTYQMASLEQSQGSLASDVVVHFSMLRPKTGMDLLTARTPGEDGFFMLSVTAGQELAQHNTGMDYVFLLDVSGSMANDAKLDISRRSLMAFVEALSLTDQFELLSFNVQPNLAFGQLRSAAEEAKAAARIFLDSQAAKGGTVLAPALTTAYRYGNPDRPLNVVLLSDGMTEQRERQELSRLIAERPAHARVFCIGIGNEVNRPLLSQMAEDSGGLAAFVSRGDDFQRQARSFRRKLVRPAATDLQLSINGPQVFDVQPKKLPNLYHGAPLRIYGRYKGDGNAAVTIRGFVQGRAFEQQVIFQFPKTDATNPEIERMWALKQVAALSRREPIDPATIDEIVELGERFSIVTRYTSFLVLENDNEYRRWKIERRNQQRIQQDRRAQQARRRDLEKLRQRALNEIGPQPAPVLAQKTSAPTPAPTAAQPGGPSPATTPSAPARTQSRDFDLGIGSGPVGPLFVGAAYWIRRRRRKR